MNNLLSDLLKEYDLRRKIANDNLEEFKKELYKANPILEKIEKEIQQISFKTLKEILKNPPSKDKLNKELNSKIASLKKQRLDILHSLNLEEDCLEPKYKCIYCKDTGYIKNNTTMCNCLKQEILNLTYNKSSLNNLANENFENFDFNKYSNKVDIDKYKINISPRDNMKNILKIVKSFIENFNNTDTKNLLFTGNTGLGKTFISSCIANEILKQNKTVLYQTAPIMFDTIIDYRFGKNDGSIYNNIISSDLLIIDDLGTETINNMKYTELFTVINCRLLSANTKTIISTNLDVNELFSRYDERLVSRFAGYYNICKFFGDDIRLK